MLSGNLKVLIQASESNPQLEISKLETGAVISITTDDLVFTVVVADPQKGAVVLSAIHPKLQEPSLFMLQGATMGGSACAIGRIILHMRIRLIGRAGMLVTTSVNDFSVIKNDVVSKRYLQVWEEYLKQDPFDEKEFNARIDASVESDFPFEHREEIRQILSAFNVDGKLITIRILSEAIKVGKLVKALELLQQALEEHWAYRPPEIRGSVMTPSDVECINGIYEGLGLEIPE
jgi:hypothetical protein